MGAAMIDLDCINSAVLYSLGSHFLARPVERKGYSAEQEDSLRPIVRGDCLFKVMGQEKCE